MNHRTRRGDVDGRIKSAIITEKTYRFRRAADGRAPVLPRQKTAARITSDAPRHMKLTMSSPATAVVARPTR